MSNSYGSATIGAEKQTLGGVDLWLEGDNKVVLSKGQKHSKVFFEPKGGRQDLKAQIGDLNFNLTVEPEGDGKRAKVELKKSLW